MITPITATFPALNFPKEIDYPTQEDWAAFSAAAELNYGILRGEWSDKSEEFKEQVNNLALEIQTIGENAFNAISLNTIEDLATYTGTGLVMVKDLNRGGTFIYDATQSAVNNGGTVFNGWCRQYSGAVNAKWFGISEDVGFDNKNLFDSIQVSLGSGVIFIPDGSYEMSSMYIRPGITVVGESKTGTIIKAIGGTGTYCIGLTQPYSGIENLTIDGTSSSGYGMLYSGVKTALMDSVVIKNFTGSSELNGCGMVLQNVFIRTITKCEITGNRVNILLRNDGNEINNITFDSCTIEYSLEEGVIVDKGTNIFFNNCGMGHHGELFDKAAIKINDTGATVYIDTLWTEFCYYAVLSSARILGYSNSHGSARVTIMSGVATVDNNEFYGLGGKIETPSGSTATVIEKNNKQIDGYQLSYQTDGIISKLLGNNVIISTTGEVQKYKTSNTGFGQSIEMRLIGGGNDTTGLVLQKKGSGAIGGGKAYIKNENNGYIVMSPSSIDTFEFSTTNFIPLSDNTKTLGAATYRWSTVYAGTGTINTSDDREKTYRDITETETLIAKELKSLMKSFRFNDSVEKKGVDKARIHYGTSAQSVKATFEKYGLIAEDYAILCHDEWDAEYEQVIDTKDELDEDGNIIKEATYKEVLVREAGDRYGIRYEELLCFIISAM